MFLRRLGVAAALLLLNTASVFAAADPIRDDVRAKLRKSAATGEKVIIRGVNLGGESLSDIEVQPFKVWADDGVVAVHKVNGTVERVRPPRIDSFKGRVQGATEESAVYLSLDARGKVEGIALVGSRRFAVSTGVRKIRVPERVVDDSNFGPVATSEDDPLDDLKDHGGTPWTCAVDQIQAGKQPYIPVPEEVRRLRLQSDAGNVTGASYTLRLTIETDAELYAAFGSTPAITAYITDLVGKASVIYQRDLSTTLVIGHSNIYSGGLTSDPWTGGTGSGATTALFGDLGTFYSTAPGLTNPNYGGTQRSTVVWVSGRNTSSGIAWVDQLCTSNFDCGPGGCGDPALANKWGGGYAFCGTSGSVTTTVPNPDLTVNGVQYGIPNNLNFWMLIEFVHELGHNVGSGHTHCVALSPAEQTAYGVSPRAFVDVCSNFEGGCFSGTPAAPAEKGTIMSYCHNLSYSSPGGTFGASRYLFWKAGEPSEKMLPILKLGLEGSTENPTITNSAPPLACSAGRTASVAPCTGTGCTYSWQITGGSITAGASTTAITFTPSAASVVLTVTATSQRGCGITASKTIATSCVAILPPTNVVAAATGATSVSVTWTAAAGAASYQIFRSDGTGFVQIGTSAGPSFNDPAATTNKSYLYRVRSVDSGAGVSADSLSDFATVVVYTDPTLTPGVTAMKVAHINDARQAVNSMRILAGLGSGTFTDPVLSSSIPIAAVHLSELRTQLNTARTTLGFTPASFPSDAAITSGLTIKEAHVTEIRTGAR